jgi:hypothetical protein
MAPDNSKTSGKTNGAAAARKAEMSSAAAEKAAAPGRELSDWVKIGVAAYCLFVVAKAAYQIRLGAINEFGPVIHEFDPYFNYRATEVSCAPCRVTFCLLRLPGNDVSRGQCTRTSQKRKAEKIGRY